MAGDTNGTFEEENSEYVNENLRTLKEVLDNLRHESAHGDGIHLTQKESEKLVRDILSITAGRNVDLAEYVAVSHGEDGTWIYSDIMTDEPNDERLVDEMVCLVSKMNEIVDEVGEVTGVDEEIREVEL